MKFNIKKRGRGVTFTSYLATFSRFSSNNRPYSLSMCTGEGDYQKVTSRKNYRSGHVRIQVGN